MHTTTFDLAILLQTVLNGGSYSGKRLLSPASVMGDDLESECKGGCALGNRICTGRIEGLERIRRSEFGPTFGHAGARAPEADPETGLLCDLTNRPLSVDNGFLRLVS